MTILWWFLGLYAAISLVFTASHLGYKGNDNRWWTWVLGAPALVIAAAVGAIGYLFNYFDPTSRRLRELKKESNIQSQK